MGKMLINIICFGTVGGVLAVMGFTFFTWQFWIIIVAMGLVQINNFIN